jgi:aminotransferase EvaB
LKKKYKINVWSYLDEYRLYKSQILKLVNKVFSSGNLILGNELKNLEKNFSKYIGNKFAVGVNSGTDAILIALLALGIKKGDEVITVSNTAVPTISAIVSTGAKPVFVDINENDFLINTSEIKKKITKKTKVIIPVNLYGQSANIKELKKISKKNNIKILEDCAQSTGAKYKGEMCGSLADISAFSFYPTKNLGAYGDAGMIVTNSKILHDKCKMLRKYGMKKLYYSEFHGINSRLDEVQASILNFKLKKLNTNILKRRQIAKIYNKKIKNPQLILPKENNECYHSYYVYVIRSKKRNKLLNYLRKNNVFCNISYPFPIHLMRGYKYLKYKKGALPITEKLSNEILSIPMYPYLDSRKIYKVIKILNEFN